MADTTTKAVSNPPTSKTWMSRLFLLSIPLVLGLGAWTTYTAYRAAQKTAFDADYANVGVLLRNNTVAIEGSVARINEALVGLAEASRVQPDMGANTFDSLADALMSRHPAVRRLGLASPTPENNADRPVTERNWLGDLTTAAPRTQYLPIRQLRAANAPVNAGAEPGPTTSIGTGQSGNASPTMVASPAAADSLLGFDLLSDGSIAQVVAQASSSGTALSYTALQKGLALFVTKVPGTNSEDNRFVFGEVDIAQLLSSTAQQTNADIQVFDESQPSGSLLLFTSLLQKTASETDRFSQITLQRMLEQKAEVKVLDRTWGVNLRPLPSMFGERTDAGAGIAALGVIATLLSSFLLYTLISRTARVQREVDAKTTELDAAYRQIREKEIMSMQTEKMSALGQMIAGVAHEINTPLGFVASNVQTIQDDFDRYLTRLESSSNLLGQLKQWNQKDDDAKRAWYKEATALAETLDKSIQRGQRPKNVELTGETIEGLERISELVSSLKDFSRVDRAPVDDVDIHHCITRTLNIARNQVKQKATVITEFANLPHVRCNPSQVNQVLLNLISNAAQAIPEFGEILIRTSQEGDAVRVDIKDNGAGMSPEVMQKVFEPFFTTKDVGKGTGLGLAISERIIKDHGGKIWADSKPTVGTTFSFTLPIRGKTQTVAEESLV